MTDTTSPLDTPETHPPSTPPSENLDDTQEEDRFHIQTNHQPRELCCLYEVPDEAQPDFGYVTGDEHASPRFFKYKGEWYDSHEFQTTRGIDRLEGWHGYQSDSFFSGVLVRYTEDYEDVIVGRYWS